MTRAVLIVIALCAIASCADDDEPIPAGVAAAARAADTAAEPPGDPFPEITTGINYYFTTGSALHRLKYTMDLSYLPDGAPEDETGAGILEAPTINCCCERSSSSSCRAQPV